MPRLRKSSRTLRRLAAVAIFGPSTRADPSPSPLSVPPSQLWSGNDGSWSTFALQVGTPPQVVHLLPGTSASAGNAIWVIAPDGCALANPDLTNCASLRGGLFYSNESTSYSTRDLTNTGNGTIYTPNTVEEAYLGLTANAYYGFDTITLGLSGEGMPSMTGQVIAGMAQDSFWIGSLGLSPWAFNFSDFNEPQLSPMGTLRNRSLGPSASWAYTAGPVFGSLTLGGYDSTRFVPNNLSFAFGSDISRDLLVSLHMISSTSLVELVLLPENAIDIFIDSLVTEIWLPVDVCESLANQLRLTWNSTLELYTVTDDEYLGLQTSNPELIFTIGQAGTRGETVNISIPYSAFDLNLSSPLVETTTRYFPIKQAQNSSQYTLGRVFLQEAYIIADYDRRNFSVSQASFPPTSVPAEIVTIDAPSNGTANDSTTANGSTAAHKSSGLSAGAIAGIVVGAVVLSGALLAIAIILFLRSRRSKRAAEAQKFLPDGTEEKNDGTGDKRNGTWSQKPELDASAPARHELGSVSKPLGTELDSTPRKIFELEQPPPLKAELHSDSSSPHVELGSDQQRHEVEGDNERRFELAPDARRHEVGGDAGPVAELNAKDEP